MSRTSAIRPRALRRIRAVGVAIFTLTLVWGCGGGDSAQTASASAAADSAARRAAASAAADVAPVPSSEPVAEDSLTGDPAVDSLLAAIRACPRDGLWHVCSLERRMQLSGLRVETVDTATTIPGIPLAAQTWLVGRQTLRVVLFPSAAEAEAAMQEMDVRRAAPKSDPSVFWPDRATLLHNANLVAVLLGGTDRQVERVSNALLAGAPQPEREQPR